MSVFFLEKIDMTFISITFGMLVAYAGNSLIIPIYTYSQAHKRLFWNNTGQVLIACISLFMCVLLGSYDEMLAVYAVPFGLLLGSYVSYLGNRRELLKEYLVLGEVNLNEVRFLRAMLVVILSVVITLALSHYFV